MGVYELLTYVPGGTALMYGLHVAVATNFEGGSLLENLTHPQPLTVAVISAAALTLTEVVATLYERTDGRETTN